MNAREQAIEVMARSIQSTPIHRRADAYRETDYRKLASRALDALLAATQEEPCPTCGGTGKEPGYDAPLGHPDSARCVKCKGSGRVPGAPLVILGPTLAHPTARILDDVPGWEGVTLPAAYHDPLREPQVHNANEAEK